MRIQSDHQSGQTELIAIGTAFCMFAGLAASWSFENTTANLLLVLPVGACLLWIYALRVAKHTYVEVDPSQDHIRAYKVAQFGKRRLEIYKLSDFRGVVSFLHSPSPGNGVPYNCVELLAKHKEKGLVIARFTPTRTDQKFLRLPAYGESNKASEIRFFFASKCGMTDLGFAGYRHSREPLLPHTESKPLGKDPIAQKRASTRM